MYFIVGKELSITIVNKGTSLMLVNEVPSLTIGNEKQGTKKKKIFNLKKNIFQK